MKIAVIGAGAMGSYIARDLAHNETGVQITIIDSDPRRASKLAASLGDGGHDFKACDALQSEALAAALSGTSVAINAAQYDVNTSVMQACLRAGNHYLDLGGMFHMTRRQLEWSEQFRTAGLTAILGMGAAPGITNVLASEACSLLDTVSRIEASFAASAPDAPMPPAFIPPYSIRTIMQEFCDESVQYIEGEHRVQKPLAGRKRITFPDPIGAVDCVYTLHSEPATLPDAFRAKGVREVCWRLGLPPALENVIHAFAAAGLGSTQALDVGGASIAPVDFLAACIERNAAQSQREEHEFTEYGCVRVEVTGAREAIPTLIAIDCMLAARGTPPDMAAVITGTPASLAAVMLARGEAGNPGAHGPESVIPPALMLERLGKRGFVTTLTEVRRR